MKMNMILAALLLAAAPCRAWGWHSHHSGKISHEPVVIAQGQTAHGDITTDKSVQVDGVLDGDCAALGGPVTVSPSGRITGDLVSMGGPVSVSGTVDGDITAFGAPVELSGSAGGDISSLGGGVTMLSSATVSGDVSALGGRVEKSGGVRLKGDIDQADLKLLRRLLPHMARLRGMEGNPLGKIALLGAFGMGLVVFIAAASAMLLLMLIAPVFFPKNVEAASQALRADFWKASGAGLLIVLAVFPCLLGLLVSILGIPLIPLALLVLVAAKILGAAAFMDVLSRRFFDGIGRPVPGRLAARVAAGYSLIVAAMLLGHIIPVMGWLLTLPALFVVAFGVMSGLGSVWLTRFGTRRCPPPQAAAPDVPPAAPPASVV